jgi:DNA-binding beta-propeller fold protein YncE
MMHNVSGFIRSIRSIHNYPRLLGVAIILTFPIGVTASGAPLAVGQSISVPGTKGRFDYLQIDGGLHRLLADHTVNGTLDVINLPDGKLEKSIAVGKAQGVAIDIANNKYYVTVSDQKKLVIIDRQTLEISGDVPVDGPPDSLAYNPKNGLVYVCQDDGEYLWAIDPKAKKLVASIKIPEAPEYVLYDSVTDRIYQNIKSRPVTLAIDPSSNKVLATWSTKPAESPHGLAIDSARGRLFCAGGNGKLSVLDAVSGNVLTSIDIVPGVDQIAFDPDNKRIYCPSGKSGLSVLEETTNGVKLMGNITIPAGAHTLAIDPATHDVWIAYGNENEAFVVRLTNPAK